MKIQILNFAVAICVALIPITLFAQQKNDSIKTTMKEKTIDEVVVLGNFKQKALLTNPLRTQASLMTSAASVDKKEVKLQGANTLIEALKYTPGAWIETRGRKVKKMFSVRGQNYPYPSYSINGIWQKEFQEMSYFFNSANIEKITINRSSSALLNSLSALTGVVNIETAKATTRETHLFAKYGSLDTYRAGASFADAKEHFGYHVAVNGMGTKGPKNFNGQENMLNTMGSFFWKISPKFQWDMNIFYLYGTRQLTQPGEPAAAKFTTQKEKYDPYKSIMVSSKMKYMVNSKLTSELQLNYAGRQPKYISYNTKTDTTTQYNETDNEFTVNWINALALNPANTLRFGLLYNYWFSPKGKRFYYGHKGKVSTYSAVLTDQHNFGRLLIDGGFRLTRKYYADWGGFNIEGSPRGFKKVTPIKNQWQSPEWQVTAGATYSFTNKSSLHASFAGGTVVARKGALNESGSTPANETRMNIDLGYSIHFSAQSSFTMTTFMVNRRNAITYSGATIEKSNNEVMELYKNVDMRNYGLEAAYHSPMMFESFSFFTNATWMMGEVDHAGDWVKDDEIPNFIANLGLNFQRDAWDVNGYLNYVGKYKNDRFVSKIYLKDNGKAPLGNFASVDITAGYRFGHACNTRLFVEAKNLLDTSYQTVPGYDNYGRILSVGVDIKF